MSDFQIDIKVYIDWDGDGNFTGTYDDITDRVIDVRWSLGSRKPYQLMADAGRATITLLNDDHYFTPENTSSPIYDKILPNKIVRIDLVYESTTYTRFKGFLKKPSRQFSLATETRITFEVEDIFANLRDAEVNIPLQENQTSDAIIRTILEGIQYPPGFTSGLWLLGIVGSSELGESTYMSDSDEAFDLEAGVRTIPYAGDNWAEGVKATQAIASVVAAERGRFFFGRDGKAYFKNSDYLQKQSTSAATWSTVSAATRAYWSDIKNSVRVTIAPRKITSNATLYTLDNDITVAAGETKTLRVRLTDSTTDQKVGGRNYVTPNTGDGSLVLSAGQVAVSLDDAASKLAINLTNNGVISAVITTLTVKGDKITDFGNLEAIAEDDDSLYSYGRQELSIDAKLLDDLEVAQRIADYELARRKDPRGLISNVRRQNEQAADDLTLELLDRVTFSAMEHVNEDYFVIGERWTWRDGGRYLEVEFSLEQAVDQAYWLLGTSGRGELGETTYLGF